MAPVATDQKLFVQFVILCQGNASMGHAPFDATETTGDREVTILRCHLIRLQMSEIVARNVG